MGLALRHGVHFCIANGEPTFLSLVEDRYFCLPPTARALFLDSVRGEPNTEALASALSGETFARLFENCELPGFSGSLPNVPRPTQSFLDEQFKTALSFQMINALSCYQAAGQRLRRQGIKRVTDILGERKRLRPGAVKLEPHFRSRVATFLALKNLVATHDQCLRWSIALLDFLHRTEFRPSLVIGVKMKPFGAHAWVQHEDLVLSDALDNVLPYTPIMVV